MLLTIMNLAKAVPSILEKMAYPFVNGDSEHIKIRKKEDNPGINIYIDGKTNGESVYIPVVVSCFRYD